MKIVNNISFFIILITLIGISSSIYAQSDACATATEIVSQNLVNGNCDDTGDNSSGAVESGEEPTCFNDDNGGFAGHWWKFYVDSPKARIFVNTDPSDAASMTAPVVQTYVGGCPGSDDVNYCDDDDAEATRAYMEVSTDVSRVALASGDSVFLLVGNDEGTGLEDGQPGVYEICVINRAPNNDEFCNAFFVDENTCLQEQSNFLSSSDGVDDGCFKTDRTIWYKGLMPADGSDFSMAVHTSGNGIENDEGISNPKVANQLFATVSGSVTTCPSPTIASDDNGCGGGSLPVLFTLEAASTDPGPGDTIYFSVSSPSDNKGRFHLCTGTGTLPVELTNFKAYSSYKSVVVKWATATETNNHFFVIERSKDGINFEEISREDGAGTSKSLISYSYIDNNPYYGYNYYRLTQYDYDGKSTTFPITVTNYDGVNMGVFSMKVLTNPVLQNQNVSIEVYSEDDDKVLMVLMDYLGNQLYIKEEVVDYGVYLSIPTNNLPSGIYIVTASQKNALISRKVVIK